MPRVHLLLLMFGFTCVALCAGVAINYIVNPYGVWRPTLVDPIYRKIQHHRAETPHLLRAAHPTTVLVGSSRIYHGMPIGQGMRDGVLNAGLDGASLREAVEVVNAALLNPKLERILWSVDFFQLNGGFDKEEAGLRARLDGSRWLLIEDTLLNLGTLGDSFDIITRAAAGRPPRRATKVAPVPWPPSLICQEFNSETFGLAKKSPWQIEMELTQKFPDLYLTYHFSTALLAMFRATVNRARARGVEVIVLVPPMSQYELELIRQRGHWDTFKEFKRQLATVGPFWDFSGYNELAHHDEFFTDVSHMKPAVGFQVLRIALGDEPADCSPSLMLLARSATRLDNENIETELVREDQMRDLATAERSRYADLVAQVIAADPRAPGRP